jgi:hypothetical protein
VIRDLTGIFAQLVRPRIKEAGICVRATETYSDRGVAIVVQDGGGGESRVRGVYVDIDGEEVYSREGSGQKESTSIATEGISPCVSWLKEPACLLNI